MSKAWLGPGLVLCLVVLFLFAAYQADLRLLKTTEELQLVSSRLRASILTEDWSKAKLLHGKLQASWPDIRRNWDLRINRDEMDKLDDALARLGAYVEDSDRAGALSELLSWKTHLTHIQQKEVFRLRNIL